MQKTKNIKGAIMIKKEILKKLSDYSQEYITKNYEYDKQKFSEIIKAGRMVYVVKKRTNASTYFYVNYIDSNKILNFPPAYLEALGGFNKDTQLIKESCCGMDRSFALHIDICRLFGVDYSKHQNYTTL